MKAITALLDIVPGWMWAIACAALFGWGGVNAYRINSAQSDLAKLKAEHAEAIVIAQQQAADQTAQLQEKKDEAIAQAEQRAKENAAAAGRARTELGRLRQQSASGAGDASTSLAACTQYAASANTVLGQCAGALVELAEAADGHVSDLKTLTGSWPAWDKFTSDMTDFQTRLQAFNFKGQ